MTFIFGVVVAHKLLLALLEHDPVAVLHDGGVACAGLLFLHFLIKLLLIHGETILTTDELCQVERESVSIEQAESLNAVELCLALSLQLFHGAVEQVYTLFESTEERVFLFLHHTSDELALCRKFRISLSHLLYEHRHELVEERFFLSEERVGIAYCTAQDAADDISGLGIARQLTVGDGERHGAQVVGAYAHGHVGLLFLTVFQSGDVLYLFYYRLEHVSVVV